MAKRNPYATSLTKPQYRQQAVPDPRHAKHSRSQRKRDAIEQENRD